MSPESVQIKRSPEKGALQLAAKRVRQFSGVWAFGELQFFISLLPLGRLLVIKLLLLWGCWLSSLLQSWGEWDRSEASLNAKGSLFLLTVKLLPPFLKINILQIVISLQLVSRVLKVLILTVFTSVPCAFKDGQISEGPYSVVLEVEEVSVYILFS